MNRKHSAATEWIKIQARNQGWIWFPQSIPGNKDVASYQTIRNQAKSAAYGFRVGDSKKGLHLAKIS